MTKLQPYLEGGKAAMLVHVPEHHDMATYEQSLSALRLASQASACDISARGKKRAGGGAGGKPGGKRSKA